MVCDFIVKEGKPKLPEMKDGIPQGMVKPCYQHSTVKKLVYDSLFYFYNIIKSDIFSRLNQSITK